MAKQKSEKPKEKVQRDPRHLSKAFQKWLDEPVLKFDDTAFSRRQIVLLTSTPCTRAAHNLHVVCLEFKIRTLDKLYTTGLDSLSRCVNIGERATMIAALILHSEGYNVDSWMRIKQKRVLTWTAATAKAQRAATARQKHG